MNEAKRIAFKRVPETCPTIRTKINELFRLYAMPIDRVNDVMEIVYVHGTGPLRNALETAITERLKCEERIEQLEQQTEEERHPDQ